MKRRRGDNVEKGVGSDLGWGGGLCFRRRPVISNQLWLTDSGGKFLAVNAACHSEGADVSSWEAGDEGRINWHSGGERWRESDGDPVDGHTLSLAPSITLLFLSEQMYCTLCFLGGVVRAGGSDGSFNNSFPRFFFVWAALSLWCGDHVEIRSNLFVCHGTARRRIKADVTPEQRVVTN